MTGAEYIAEFIHQIGCKKVFTITGGACAFVVDAIARHPTLDYVCFQHEQAAAMAADSTWRIGKIPGVTVATSGPGATNLITGIACSYFDSIPAIHITGQVNKSESAASIGAKVRQAGFQETNIVDMVRPITKYAVQVNSAEELRAELKTAVSIATSGRMGPVLIDVPMNIQKEEVGDHVELPSPPALQTSGSQLEAVSRAISELFANAARPLVLFGGGVGLAKSEDVVMQWLQQNQIPFVASWSGMSYFNHEDPNYCGPIGVYGNRGSNFILQNCDALLVLGSRLDTRQRSGNWRTFATDAKIVVVDVDEEELKKLDAKHYRGYVMDLADLSSVLQRCAFRPIEGEWSSYIEKMKSAYLWKEVVCVGKPVSGLSPYSAVRRLNCLVDDDAIIVADCGANLCWVYQTFKRTRQTLYTAAGNSPMGYSLPAAIGAALAAPHRQVVAFIGDGGLQMNIQELQTVVHYGLPIKIVVLNNHGYGIIKQFQDSYFESRYEATGRGYSVPDFGKIAEAYGICFTRVTSQDQMGDDLFAAGGAQLIDVVLDDHAQILPKLEMGRPIHDQYPYMSEDEFSAGNPFVWARRRGPTVPS